MTRDESQQNFVDVWIKKKFKGGCAAVTSWGKTRTAIKCALQSKATDTIVIVPTKELKKQWGIVLREWKVPNTLVYIVNTAATLSLKCDLLIIDEAHTTGCADWFKKSWKNANFNKIIWLSATPERKDNKHLELFKIAPRLMTITYETALKNKWISNYTIYNVGIDFTPKERIKYDKIQDDLDILYKDIAKNLLYEIEYVKKNAFSIARSCISSKNWDQIKYGKRYYTLIGKRKNLLYNAENKLKRTVNYINKNPDKKVLIFSQSQEFADTLQDQLGDICVTIHSSIKDKQREINLNSFRDGRTKKRVISSIKALNEGIDIPELEVGICASGTSSKKDAIQQLGRVCRLYRDKHALFFNLYVKGTQDLYWLNNRQWDLDKSKIKWV